MTIVLVVRTLYAVHGTRSAIGEVCKLVVEALLYSFLAVINSTVIQLLIRTAFA